MQDQVSLDATHPSSQNSLCFPLPSSHTGHVISAHTGLTGCSFGRPQLAVAREGAGFAVPRPQGSTFLYLTDVRAGLVCGWSFLPPWARDLGLGCLAQPAPLPPGDRQSQAPWVPRTPPWGDPCYPPSQSMSASSLTPFLLPCFAGPSR